MKKNGRRRITLKDIAEKTGYTVNTVSKALKDKSDLAPKTREYIRRTADEMGYVANDVAGALRSGFTKTIALIVSDISNPFFSIVAKEVDAAAECHGYSVLIMNTEEDQRREEEMLRLSIAKNVDGVLLFPTQIDTAGIQLLKNAGVPCVLIGRYFDQFRLDSITYDDRRGGYLATEHLLMNGYRKIIMLNAPMHISSSRDRLAGYHDALSAFGLDPDAQRVLTVSSALGGVKTILADAVEGGLSFDAIFAFSDLIAFQCVCALGDMGMKVPKDIAVVGFDDIQSKLVLPFPLTTICLKKSTLAKASFELLLRRISGDYADYPIRQILDVHLVSRESGGNPAQEIKIPGKGSGQVH